jgi:hypothetical protein
MHHPSSYEMEDVCQTYYAKNIKIINKLFYLIISSYLVQ